MTHCRSLKRRVQVAGDVRQRDVHDRDVEQQHERRDAHGEQRPALARGHRAKVAAAVRRPETVRDGLRALRRRRCHGRVESRPLQGISAGDASDGPPTVGAVLVRDFTDGLDVDQVLLVREVEARGQARRRRVPEGLASPTARARCPRWSGRASSRCARCACAGRPVRVLGRFAQHPRYGGQLALRALRPRRSPGRSTPTSCCDGPPRSADAMEADLRELVATVQDPHLRACSTRVLGAGVADLGALPRRARRPSTTTRPTATGCSSTACRSPRRVSAVARDVPRHRPRRRGHRRAAARHRQARRLHRRPGGAST